MGLFGAGQNIEVIIESGEEIREQQYADHDHEDTADRGDEPHIVFDLLKSGEEGVNRKR